MTNSLQSLFEAVADASNEQELRLHVMVQVSEYFLAERCQLFLFNQLPSSQTNIPSMIKLALSVEHNPEPFIEIHQE